MKSSSVSPFSFAVSFFQDDFFRLPRRLYFYTFLNLLFENFHLHKISIWGKETILLLSFQPFCLQVHYLRYSAMQFKTLYLLSGHAPKERMLYFLDIFGSFSMSQVHLRSRSRAILSEKKKDPPFQNRNDFFMLCPFNFLSIRNEIVINCQ